MLHVGQTVWGFFIVIDTHGHAFSDYAELTLECQSCGREFEVDTQTDLNMTLNESGWVPECPFCGQKGTPDIPFL